MALRLAEDIKTLMIAADVECGNKDGKVTQDEIINVVQVSEQAIDKLDIDDDVKTRVKADMAKKGFDALVAMKRALAPPKG